MVLNYLAVSRQPREQFTFLNLAEKQAPGSPGGAEPHTTCRLRSCPSSCTLSLCSSSISRLCRSVLWRTSER